MHTSATHCRYWHAGEHGRGSANNNNNINHYNVFGALVMTIVIARVHPIHLMNVAWSPGTANLQTKPIDLGCESAKNWQLPSTLSSPLLLLLSP